MPSFNDLRDNEIIPINKKQEMTSMALKAIAKKFPAHRNENRAKI